MSATSENTAPRAANVDVAAGLYNELANLRLLLHALLNQDRQMLLQLVVGNFDRRELTLMDAPGPMAKRLLVPRQGEGGLIAVASGTVTPVLAESEARIGGNIVNSGGFPVRLYKCNLGDVGGAGAAPSGQANQRPSSWLAASGGAYDFRESNAVYGGAIQAVGIGGASTLDVSVW